MSYKHNIFFHNFDFFRDSHLIGKLVDCYRDVFADYPWNEWKVCPVCGSKWGLKHKNKLKELGYKCCDRVYVEDFWPKEKVRADIEKEVFSSDALCTLAIDEQYDVIGFCWGYLTNIYVLEKKLELANLASSFRKFPPENEVLYQDEMGVRKDYRRRGIAKMLYAQWIRYFLDMEVDVILARTQKYPPTVVYHWYIKIGYKPIAQYNDKSNRVILASEIDSVSLQQYVDKKVIRV